MKDAGVQDVIYTDIRRDGMQTGPNVEATAELVRRTGLRVIGSGGVGKIQDLYDLRDAGDAMSAVGAVSTIQPGGALIGGGISAWNR